MEWCPTNIELDFVIEMLKRQGSDQRVGFQVSKVGSKWVIGVRSPRNDGEVHIVNLFNPSISSPSFTKDMEPISGLGCEAGLLLAGVRLIRQRGGWIVLEKDGDAGTARFAFYPNGGGEVYIPTGLEPWFPSSHRWTGGVTLSRRVSLGQLASVGSAAGADGKAVIGIGPGTVEGKGNIYGTGSAPGLPIGGFLFRDYLESRGEIPSIGLSAASFSLLARGASPLGRTDLFWSEGTFDGRPQALLIETRSPVADDEDPHQVLAFILPSLAPKGGSAMDKLAEFPRVWTGVVDKAELVSACATLRPFLPVDGKGHHLEGGSVEVSFGVGGMDIHTRSSFGGGTVSVGATEGGGREAVKAYYSLPEIERLASAISTDGVAISVANKPGTALYALLVEEPGESSPVTMFLAPRSKAAVESAG